MITILAYDMRKQSTFQCILLYHVIEPRRASKSHRGRKKERKEERKKRREEERERERGKTGLMNVIMYFVRAFNPV